MLFNSLSFAIFLPIVFSIYWLLPHKYRWILILAASYYFYMSWNAKYIVLILFTTCVSYGAARLLENEKNLKKKKMILGISAFLCLLVLFFFKYFNFVSESFTAFLEIFTIQLNPITLKLFLPVGISFYTFQTLSYVIDVYRGKIPAEKHFGYYAAFVSFFPQLVAGPIERAADLMPQIKEEHTFDYDNAVYGLKLMAWGLFKKMVIADTLSKYVSAVYDAPPENGWIFTHSCYFLLLVSDLLRLLRIFGYCSRNVKASGHSPIDEFQKSLFLTVNQGILEPLAHFTVHLVSGLRLYSSGRKPHRKGSSCIESFDNLSGKRTVAWSQLDIRSLGRNSWCGAGSRKYYPSRKQDEEPWYCGILPNSLCIPFHFLCMGILCI